MDITELIVPPDANTLDAITKELKEDPDRLARQLELFKEWLRCESHLPKDLDEKFMENFVRQCKCDLEKAKRKFELYLVGRARLLACFPKDVIDEGYFKKHLVHRIFFPCPHLTPDGYRLEFVKFLDDPELFNFTLSAQYGLRTVDLLLFEDVCAGNILVYDLKNLTAQAVGRLNVKLLADMLNWVYNMAPFRLKAIHVVNMTTVAEIMVIVLKKVLSEKMAKRIIIHKDVKELIDYIPPHVLPEDYGGTDLSTEKMSDKMATFFTNDKVCIKKSEKLVLNGPLPPNKRALYSFEDFEMGGSFRQLTID